MAGGETEETLLVSKDHVHTCNFLVPGSWTLCSKSSCCLAIAHSTFSDPFSARLSGEAVGRYFCGRTGRVLWPVPAAWFVRSHDSRICAVASGRHFHLTHNPGSCGILTETIVENTNQNHIIALRYSNERSDYPHWCKQGCQGLNEDTTWPKVCF